MLGIDSQTEKQIFRSLLKLPAVWYVKLSFVGPLKDSKILRQNGNLV